ncbi:MAG: DUF4142 domain-containing protein [Terracidiphilus sp.]
MSASETGKRFLVFTSAALFAGAVAMAQQQPGGMPNQPNQQPGQPSMPGQQSPTPGYSNNPETGVPGAQESMSRSFADEVFVRDILQSSAVEAQMSQLAEQRSASGDVKQFGQQMVLIHNELDKQLRPIASQLGVRQNPKLGKKQKREFGQLTALSGPAFDRAYIEEMAKHQRHDVKLFKTEASTAQSPRIQHAARMDAPVFSQHLKRLERIAQNHGVTLAKK